MSKANWGHMFKEKLKIDQGKNSFTLEDFFKLLKERSTTDPPNFEDFLQSLDELYSQLGLNKDEEKHEFMVECFRILTK